jgi:hypothetical protein
MPDLITTQRAFAAALRDGALAARTATLLVGDEGLASRRLAVYRGNALAAAARALGAAFPVAKQVVGWEFFDAMARRYWRDTPSVSGDLHDYGTSLADFVAGFEPARELPYLADLIALEWRVHRAYCAPSVARLDARELAALPAEAQGRVRLALLPGTSLLESAYPVATVWTIHQPEHQGAFEVDWSVGERVLVYRDGLRVAVRCLDRAHLALYRSIEGGACLNQALEAAALADPACDLVRIVTDALATGPLVSVSGARENAQPGAM